MRRGGLQRFSSLSLLAAVMAISALTGCKKHRDLPDSLKAFGERCNDGDAAACVTIAHAYEVGNIVEPNPVEAANIYRDACQKDHGQACLSLAKMHRDARGVAPDAQKTQATFARAAELLGTSCDAGDAFDCFTLGELLENSDSGLPPDPARANELFTRACHETIASACKKLAPKDDIHGAM